MPPPALLLCPVSAPTICALSSAHFLSVSLSLYQDLDHEVGELGKQLAELRAEQARLEAGEARLAKVRQAGKVSARAFSFSQAGWVGRRWAALPGAVWTADFSCWLKVGAAAAASRMGARGTAILLVLTCPKSLLYKNPPHLTSPHTHPMPGTPPRLWPSWSSAL